MFPGIYSLNVSKTTHPRCYSYQYISRWQTGRHQVIPLSLVCCYSENSFYVLWNHKILSVMSILPKGEKNPSPCNYNFEMSPRLNNLKILFLFSKQKLAIRLFSELSPGLVKIGIYKKEMSIFKKNYNTLFICLFGWIGFCGLSHISKNWFAFSWKWLTHH